MAHSVAQFCNNFKHHIHMHSLLYWSYHRQKQNVMILKIWIQQYWITD